MRIKVKLTLKKSVLDPQGTIIQQTLDGMGFNNVNNIRQGKFFEIDIDEKDQKKAEEKVEDMCKKLLANLVIEDYKIIESQ
jgi:phosphoribosylformylglycinamidine synthase